MICAALPSAGQTLRNYPKLARTRVQGAMLKMSARAGSKWAKFGHMWRSRAKRWRDLARSRDKPNSSGRCGPHSGISPVSVKWCASNLEATSEAVQLPLQSSSICSPTPPQSVSLGQAWKSRMRVASWPDIASRAPRIRTGFSTSGAGVWWFAEAGRAREVNFVARPRTEDAQESRA